MKKLIAISLAVVYLMVSSGLLVEIHHCMGRFANAGITLIAASDNHTCSKCGMELGLKKNHCCKNEYKLVKISDDQKLVSLHYLIEAPFAILQQLGWQELTVPVNNVQSIVAFRANAPPPGLPVSKNVLYCVFRI